MSDSKGTVTWNLDVEMAQFGEGTLSAYLWVVEGSAYFEEGSNGLGDYPHIVRDIIHLGNDTQGSMSVDLPAAFDGDDLSVHLIYQFNPLIPEEPVVPTPVVVEETRSLSLQHIDARYGWCCCGRSPFVITVGNPPPSVARGCHEDLCPIPNGILVLPLAPVERPCNATTKVERPEIQSALEPD